MTRVNNIIPLYKYLKLCCATNIQTKTNHPPCLEREGG